MKDYNKLFNDELNERLTAEIFPKEELPARFKDWLSKSLMNHNIFTLDCTLATLEELHDQTCRYFNSNGTPKSINMLAAVNAINAIQKSTPKDWEDVVEYLQAQRSLQAMSDRWNEIATPIREELQAKYTKMVERDKREAEAKSKIAKPGKSIHLGKI